MKDGSSLFCAVGGVIPFEEAVKLGLAEVPEKQTNITEPIIDEAVEWAKADHKVKVEAESKMIDGPAENKAEQMPKTRKKKAA